MEGRTVESRSRRGASTFEMGHDPGGAYLAGQGRPAIGHRW